MPGSAALTAVLFTILFIAVTPAARAANTFADNAMPVRLQLKWRHQFQFAGFYTAAPPRLANATYRNDRYLNMGYGGLELGVTTDALRLAHVAARALVGAGGAGHTSRHAGDVYVGTDVFGVLEPGVEVWLNVHALVRVAFGVGYHFTYGVELPGVIASNDRGLDGANFDLTLYLGSF